MASTGPGYGRAIRPFQQQRLLTALAGLQARSAHIAGVMARLADQERYGPDLYRYELGQTMDALEALSDEAHEVWQACQEAYDSAEKDWERAMDAMLRVLKVETAEPPAQVAA